MLLYNKIRDELYNENLLRPLVKPTDFIWQQMSWGNFNKLLDSGKLYFKAYSEYDEYDEMRFSQFAGKSTSGEIENLLTQIERKMFVSCWYNSPDLSDVVFKQYTGTGCGIAIGLRVDKLLNAIETNTSGKKNKFYVGNTQYLRQEQLENTELFDVTQVIAPVFLKGLQFRMDNEFRICAYTQQEADLGYNSDENVSMRLNNTNDAQKKLENCLPCKRFKLEAIERADTQLKEKNKTMTIGEATAKLFAFGCLKDLIERVAIMNKGIFNKYDENKLKAFLQAKMGVTLKTGEMSGFYVFEV